MSNIVFIKYHLNSFGGLEKYFSRVIDAFLKKGFKITILTTSISQKDSSKNIKIVTFNQLKTLKFLKLKLFDLQCKAWLKKNSYNLVFSFDRTSTFSYTRLGNGLHITYLKRRKIFESHFKSFLNYLNPLHRVILNIEKKGFEQDGLKTIIVNSNMVKEELVNEYDLNISKVKVILNGVEHSELENEFSTWEEKKIIFLKKLNLNPKSFHFVFIGNDYKRKGLKFLLKALLKIKNEAETKKLDFHLSIIGKDKNTKKYIKFVKKNKMDEQISFYNIRKDIINFLQMADCFVLPTLYDPFANVVLEALAMGVFTITSIYNGAKQIITEENGIVLDPIDIDTFSKTLYSVMQRKKTFEKSKKIRQTIKSLDFSNQLDKLINEVVS